MIFDLIVLLLNTYKLSGTRSGMLGTSRLAKMIFTDGLIYFILACVSSLDLGAQLSMCTDFFNFQICGEPPGHRFHGIKFESDYERCLQRPCCSLHNSEWIYFEYIQLKLTVLFLDCCMPCRPPPYVLHPDWSWCVVCTSFEQGCRLFTLMITLTLVPAHSLLVINSKVLRLPLLSWELHRVPQPGMVGQAFTYRYVSYSSLFFARFYWVDFCFPYPGRIF